MLEGRIYLESKHFGVMHTICCVGSQVCDRIPLLFPRVTQASMVLREKLVPQV